ncbi:MAG: peptidylprolyl isomerase [bacterium]
MKIDEDRVVTLEYEMKDPQGTVLDGSGEESYEYIHGTETILPGLEAALEGAEEGDTFTVTLPPEKAFGERQDDLMARVPRERFEEGQELAVGMRFSGQVDGEEQIFTIRGIEGDEVTLDANHPLAGMTVTFDVEIKNVREASEQEIARVRREGPEAL